MAYAAPTVASDPGSQAHINAALATVTGFADTNKGLADDAQADATQALADAAAAQADADTGIADAATAQAAADDAKAALLAWVVAVEDAIETCMRSHPQNAAFVVLQAATETLKTALAPA